jgi:hypothetical protein
MTFRSLGSSAFSLVASKRQAYAATGKALDALLDADPCNRRCACQMAPSVDAAKKALEAAYADLRAAETAWSEFCEIRRTA